MCPTAQAHLQTGLRKRSVRRAALEEWLRYADARVDTAHDYSPFRNHSPLEGESARQGRSPQPSRWGDKQQACLDSMDNFIDDAIGLYQTMSGETWE